MRRLPLLVLAVALLPGCAGPDRPLDLGFREVPSDIVLGARPTPTTSPAATPGPQTVLPPPSVVIVPPPVFPGPPRPESPAPRPPLPTPSDAGCPRPDPLAAPAVEAPSSFSRPPRPGAYLFRNAGTFAVSGAEPRKGRFPGTSLRVVKDVARVGADDARWSVSETLGETTTTTTYRLFTGDVMPGIYLERIDYRRADGAEASFTPAPSLRLAALPLVRGATEDVGGVDPSTQTAMSFRSTVAGKAKVYACGVPLDSWTVELTNGRLVSPTQDLVFRTTYAIGTQFGGLVLRDSTEFSGTDSGAGVQRTNTATIDQVPALP